MASPHADYAAAAGGSGDDGGNSLLWYHLDMVHAAWNIPAELSADMKREYARKPPPSRTYRCSECGLRFVPCRAPYMCADCDLWFHTCKALRSHKSKCINRGGVHVPSRRRLGRKEVGTPPPPPPESASAADIGDPAVNKELEAANEGASSSGGGRRGIDFDLNLPAPEEEEEQ